MDMLTIVALVRVDGIAQAHAGIVEAAARATVMIAERIRQEAENTAPVDTGSMAAGYYVRTDRASGYDDATSATLALNPNAVLLSETDQPPEGAAVVSNAAMHSVFVEEGTVHMPARPILQTAAHAVGARA